MTMRKNISTLLGVASVVALLAGLFFLRASYLSDSSQADSTSVFQVTPVAVAKPDTDVSPSRPAPAGFSEYHNATYHFSLFYPQDLSAREYKEVGTAMTVTFEGPFSDRGFQVFVVPYGEKRVTPERFKTDVPSGIIASSTDITLDGIAATAFYSRNQAMGDTYEIWFLYHGFLYEVTTYKEFDAWLNEIMSSWKFL